MDNRRPLVWCHRAVSALHRRVAVTDFLQVMHRSAMPVFCDRNDLSVDELRELAAQVGVPLTTVRPEDRSAIGGGAWIGTHPVADRWPCLDLYGLVPPPHVILCLDVLSFSRHGLAHHRDYITGYTGQFRAIASHSTSPRDRRPT